MKKLVVILVSVFFMASLTSVNAQCCKNKTAKCSDEKTTQNVNETGQIEKSFKVAGECDMCEERIEKAALSIKAVKTAVWEVKTQMLTVVMTEDIGIEPVQKAIAAVGHDTETFKAENAVYEKLPACCKYERL